MSIILTENQKKAREKICLPLDNLHSIEEIEERIMELGPVVGLFKIGKGTFTRFGPSTVNLVKKHGAEVFLDLKYHDIPATVKDASFAATELGVSIFNVHASGGLEMMKAAVEGADEASKKLGLKRPKVIAVTILTSINEEILNNELKVEGSVEDQVLHLAKLAEKAGLNGIVCSAKDLSRIKEFLPKEFIFITPGIAGPKTGAGSDQKRVHTPKEAIMDGSSLLVVGRAITSPKTKEERIQAALDIINDIAGI